MSERAVSGSWAPARCSLEQSLSGVGSGQVLQVRRATGSLLSAKPLSTEEYWRKRDYFVHPDCGF